jgi:DNA repair protein RadC
MLSHTLVPIYRLVRDSYVFAEDLPVLDNPAVVNNVALDVIPDDGKEHFVAFLVNVRKRIIGVCEVSSGIINASLVRPAEVFQAHVLHNADVVRRPYTSELAALLGTACEALACAIVVVHNHPSGDTFPSAEDGHVTRRLQAAGSILGIELLDHMIVSHANPSVFYSYRGAGSL